MCINGSLFSHLFVMAGSGAFFHSSIYLFIQYTFIEYFLHVMYFAANQKLSATAIEIRGPKEPRLQVERGHHYSRSYASYLLLL